jgi:spore germination protein PD
LIGITSSASLLVGDTESLTLYSFFDTPAESLIVGPLAPLPLTPGEEAG